MKLDKDLRNGLMLVGGVLIILMILTGAWKVKKSGGEQGLFAGLTSIWTEAGKKTGGFAGTFVFLVVAIVVLRFGTQEGMTNNNNKKKNRRN